MGLQHNVSVLLLGYKFSSIANVYKYIFSLPLQNSGMILMTDAYVHAEIQGEYIISNVSFYLITKKQL